MNNDGVIELTKEEARYIAKFNENDEIHCFTNPGVNLLVGIDYSRESFEESVENSTSIEVGGEHCRKMEHALAVWLNKRPYFFNHDEEKLIEVLKNKEV